MTESFSEDFPREARRIMARQARTVIRHAERLFAPDDPEPIHQMRVAINKLRLALRVFEVAPKREARRLEEDLRWFKKRLGPVRDNDVTLALLRDLATPRSEGDEEGLKIVLQAIESDRAAALDALRTAAASARYRRLEQGLAVFVKSMSARRKPQRSLAPAALTSVRVEEILSILRRRLEKRRRTLAASFEHKEMHEFRIAAKKVRYILAFFRGAKPLEFVPSLDLHNALHECAGAIHDIEVLIPRIEAIFAEHLRAVGEESARRAAPGVDWLIGQLYIRRRALMAEFASLWARFAP